MTVRWRPRAVADRRAIRDHIEADNPLAALRIVEVLVRAADGLGAMPHRGRPGRTPGTRELVVLRTYVIVYRVRDDGAVTFLRLWHGAQDRP